MLICAFSIRFHAPNRDVPFTWTYLFNRGLFLGVSFFLLVAVLFRALDWRSKRKLVFRKAPDPRTTQRLDSLHQNSNDTNA